MKFIPARWFTPTSGRDIRWLVLHVPQFPERPDAAEALARYFQRGERKASTHYVVDDTEIVQCVHDDDVAFGAASANRHGLHWEMVGFAEQTPDQWDDDYSQKVIARTAAHVGEKAAQYGIPLRFVDAAGLRRGEPGITTHYEVNRAWPSTGHTDPGRHFPIARFLALADLTAPQEDDMNADQDRMLKDLHDVLIGNRVRGHKDPTGARHDLATPILSTNHEVGLVKGFLVKIAEKLGVKLG